MHRPPQWAEMLVTISLLPPKNELPLSVNNSWSCILDNLRAMERRYPIINLLAAFTGKNADDIASSSYDWAHTERQRFLWGLCKLHCNQLPCTVTESSPTCSVCSNFSIIHLHKYACNVSQILFFGLKLWSQYLRTHCLLECIVTFGLLSSGITQLSNSYRHVGSTIFEHLIAGGYDLFQQWRCMYRLFPSNRPFLAYNHWSPTSIGDDL